MRSARMKLLGALLGMAGLVAAGAARADDAPPGTLDRIRQTNTIRIAYRGDAPPFSYNDSIGLPAGLMVDLCKAVADNLTRQLNLPSLKVAYVPVTVTDRFEAIEQHKADLLCEPTSATLSRRKSVDFSIATFIDGAGFSSNSVSEPLDHVREKYPDQHLVFHQENRTHFTRSD